MKCSFWKYLQLVLILFINMQKTNSSYIFLDKHCYSHTRMKPLRKIYPHFSRALSPKKKPKHTKALHYIHKPKQPTASAQYFTSRIRIPSAEKKRNNHCGANNFRGPGRSSSDARAASGPDTRERKKSESALLASEIHVSSF